MNEMNNIVNWIRKNEAGIMLTQALDQSQASDHS